MEGEIHIDDHSAIQTNNADPVTSSDSVQIDRSEDTKKSLSGTLSASHNPNPGHIRVLNINVGVLGHVDRSSSSYFYIFAFHSML